MYEKGETYAHHNMDSSPNIARVMISRWMGWAENVASVKNIRNTWKLHSENLKGRPHGGPVGWGTAPQARRSRVWSPWCYWNFPLTQFFQVYYGPGVDSTSNRNEYQGYFQGSKVGRCLGMTTPTV